MDAFYKHFEDDQCLLFKSHAKQEFESDKIGTHMPFLVGTEAIVYNSDNRLSDFKEPRLPLCMRFLNLLQPRVQL